MFYKEKYLKYKYKNSIIISEINELILNIKINILKMSSSSR